MREIKTPWNPSKSATRRVKNPLPAPEDCNHCGRHGVEIKNNEFIYGREYGRWPWIYYCDGCKAYVGMHPFTNIPLGTLADEKTRSARKENKALFEMLYKSGKATRTEAYSKLAKALKIKVEECHFGWFDAATCEKAGVAVTKIYHELNKAKWVH